MDTSTPAPSRPAAGDLDHHAAMPRAIGVRGHLRLVPRPLRVVDVAPRAGVRAAALAPYLAAKARFAAHGDVLEQHVLVPGDGRRAREELAEALAAIEPDVVLLHDPFRRPREICRLARAVGSVAVMVHHGSGDGDAHTSPEESGLRTAALRAWLRHAYAEADAVMAASNPWVDTGRRAAIPLRLGLDPAFVPRPDLPRGDHVLYVGPLARAKGVFTLLEAAACGTDTWTLRMIGTGPAERALRARAGRLGVRRRLRLRPPIADPWRLAEEYATAGCVVMPGPCEAFGLVGLEAAACGAPVVACESAPTAALIDGCLVFPPGDAEALAARVARALRRPRDPRAAAALAARHSWDAVFEGELRYLRGLARR